jgi:hypothetical protein
MLSRQKRRAFARATGTAFIPRPHEVDSKLGYRRIKEWIATRRYIDTLPDVGERMAALAKLPQYFSRGHGIKQSFGIASRAGKVVSRSKYMPHDGGHQKAPHA